MAFPYRLSAPILRALSAALASAVTYGCSSSPRDVPGDAATREGDAGSSGDASSGNDGGAVLSPETGGQEEGGPGLEEDADAASTGSADDSGDSASSGDGEAGGSTSDAAPAGDGGGVPLGGHVLLVVSDDPVPAPNVGMTAAMTAMGLTVDLFDTSKTPLTVAAAAGKVLVVINPNTARAYVQASFASVPVPVIVSKDGPSDTMMMSTGASSTDPAQTMISIIAPGDPLAAGFPMGNVTVYPQGNRVIFGTPSAAATKVATVVGKPNEVAIYYYPAGAAMIGGFKAPAKRVGFFWHRTSDVTPDGRKLFSAAVAWALAP